MRNACRLAFILDLSCRPASLALLAARSRVHVPCAGPGTDYCIYTLSMIAASPTPTWVNITFYIAKVAGNSANAPINSDPNPFYGQTATFTLALTPNFQYFNLPFLFNLMVPDNTRAGIFFSVNTSFLWGTTEACDGGDVDGYPDPGISIADTFQARFQNLTNVQALATVALFDNLTGASPYQLILQTR